MTRTKVGIAVLLAVSAGIVGGLEHSRAGEVGGPDVATQALFDRLERVRHLSLSCAASVVVVQPDYRITDSTPLDAVIPGTIEFFVDTAAGNWRTITDLGPIGSTDVIITDFGFVQASNQRAGVGTFGELPADVHPSSAMMLPDPLLLTVAHLLPWSESRASTLPTWRDLRLIKIPDGSPWAPAAPADAGLPEDSAQPVLVADFPGGAVDDASLVYRVWRLADSVSPLRTALRDEDETLLLQIDFTYGDAGGEWPAAVLVTQFEEGSIAGWYALEVTAISINDPATVPGTLWSHDFAGCNVLVDLDSGSLVSLVDDR